MNKKGIGQIQWTVALVLIALFVVALLGFGIGFAKDNNAAVSISNDSQINSFSTNLNGNLSGFNGGAQGTFTSIQNSTIEGTGATTTTSGAPFSITPANVFSVVDNIMQVANDKITGGNPSFSIFIMTFLALVVFITALLLWRTWAGRNPE